MINDNYDVQWFVFLLNKKNKTGLLMINDNCDVQWPVVSLNKKNKTDLLMIDCCVQRFQWDFKECSMICFSIKRKKQNRFIDDIWWLWCSMICCLTEQKKRNRPIDDWLLCTEISMRFQRMFNGLSPHWVEEVKQVHQWFVMIIEELRK